MLVTETDVLSLILIAVEEATESGGILGKNNTVCRNYLLLNKQTFACVPLSSLAVSNEDCIGLLLLSPVDGGKTLVLSRSYCKKYFYWVLCV